MALPTQPRPELAAATHEGLSKREVFARDFAYALLLKGHFYHADCIVEGARLADRLLDELAR